jgi:hypothetical protein
MESKRGHAISESRLADPIGRYANWQGPVAFHQHVAKVPVGDRPEALSGSPGTAVRLAAPASP